MNFYVNLINNTIEYIEENIHERLSLGDISKRFCVSEFHFNRMFKTVVGKTLKQYILARKLTLACEKLGSDPDVAIIDIAYDFGFEYPEVFSRAFKRQFGFAPSVCKNNKSNIELVGRAKIVERDIINFKGTLTLKSSFEYLNDLYLKGLLTEVDENDENFEKLLRSTGETFLMETQGMESLNHQCFYTVVSCQGEGNGKYNVFYGKEINYSSQGKSLKTRIVSGGWYAVFLYNGDMFDIRETFTDDLYKWIMVKEIELNPNGIGMLNIYDKDYTETGNVQMLVPIKKPK